MRCVPLWHLSMLAVLRPAGTVLWATDDGSFVPVEVLSVLYDHGMVEVGPNSHCSEKHFWV